MAIKVFGVPLARQEYKVLDAITQQDFISYKVLEKIVWGQHPPSNIKNSVKVVYHKVKNKFNLNIETHHKLGYEWKDLEQKSRLREELDRLNKIYFGAEE